MGLPVFLGIIPLFMLMNKLHLHNRLLGLILVYATPLESLSSSASGMNIHWLSLCFMPKDFKRCPWALRASP